MSTVTYNGVTMSLTRTNDILIKPVMSSDNTQYTCTQWTHDFVALLNPANISYDANGRQIDGQLPSITIQGIRHKLMQPRQSYTWTVGTDTVISSPSGDATTDMRNGPLVEFVSVNAIHGIRAWSIRMRITTWINECAERPVILSHRWRPSIDVDKDFYTTRRIVGEAQFNIPRLIELSAGADNYRINLGHPVPANFQRGGVRVAISEDGSTVHYEFIDQERPINIGTNAPIADLDVSVSTGLTQGTMADVGKAFLGGISGGLMSASQMSWGDGGISNLFKNPLVGVTTGAMNGLISASQQLARVFIVCTVAVVGKRTSSISELIELCSIVAANRCGALNFFGPSLVGMTCDINWTRKQVVWTQKHSISGADWMSKNGVESIIRSIESIIQNTQGFFSAQGNPNTFLPGGNRFVNRFKQRLERLPDDINVGRLQISSRNVGNPKGGTGGTSGTWLEKMVIQSLLEPCVEPTLATTTNLYRTKSDRNVTLGVADG